MGLDNFLFAKPKFGTWTMEFLPGRGWRLIDPNGTAQAGLYGNRERALTALEAAQARTDAARKRTTRNCMCCRTPFDSEGIHNRLCTRCRASGGDWNPYGVAPRSGRPR